MYFGKFDGTWQYGDSSGSDYLKARDFARRMRKSWAHQAMFCESSLTGEQRGIARRRIGELWGQKALPPEIPIIVTESGKYFPAAEVPGFLTIPWDFDMKQLKGYLIDNLTDVRLA